MSHLSPYPSKPIEHIRGISAGPPALSPYNNPNLRMTPSEEYRRETVGERAALSLMCLCFLVLAASTVLFMAEFVGESHYSNACSDLCEANKDQMAVVCETTGCCAGTYYKGEFYADHCTAKQRTFLTWGIICAVISVVSLCTAGYFFVKARHGIIRKKCNTISKTLQNVKIIEAAADNQSGMTFSPRNADDMATPDHSKGKQFPETPATAASGFAFSPRYATVAGVNAVPAQIPVLKVPVVKVPEVSTQSPRTPGSPTAADVIKDAALRGISRRDLLACLQAPNALPVMSIKTPAPEPPALLPSPRSPVNSPRSPVRKYVRKDEDWTSPPPGSQDPDMMSNFRDIELVAVK